MVAWKFDALDVMDEKNSSFRNIIMVENEHVEYMQFQAFKQLLLTKPIAIMV